MYRSSKSSKSKSKRWGEYSDWAWEADQKFWYRVRQDADGNLDYDYSYNKSGGQESIPRSGDDVVDELSEDYGNLSLQTDHQDSEYQTAGGQSSSSHGKSRSSKPSKGKERRHERDRYESGADTSRDSRRQPVVDETDDYSYSNATGGGGYATGDTYYQNSYPSDSASSSRQAAYTTADSTYEATDSSYDSLYNQPLGSYAYDQYTTPSGAYAYPAYEQDDGEGRLTPKAGSSSKTSHMAADVSEALDPRYRLERSDRFQPGEIFKAGWAEPKGAANDVLTGLSGKQEIEDTRGVTFVTGFRRFIVIANDQGHSTCVPILSYGGKACKKNGVKPEKHGIIYQRGQRPKLLDGEPKLGFPPVKVDITMEGEKLSKESRVNYSKLVTVEHNVKVMFIGTISANDWPIVPDAINRCWDQKDHHKRSRHRR